jgi:bis(5'-adenosyl)-triphosphatase
MKELTIADIARPADCPFCSSALQRSAFRADERFLALYNIAPILPGHSLVMPRAHVESALTLADADLAALVVFAGRVTRLLARAFAADGFDWTIQDGRSAGQSVPHLHLHIIPRHMGDLPEPGDWYPALTANEGATIDSTARARLTPAEHERITRHLREFAIREQ